MGGMKQIILASASPRRKVLLEQLGLKFKVVPSRYEEDMTLPLSPAALARRLSQGKAREVVARYPRALVIAADTFVVRGREVIGKPRDKEEARTVLQRLSGRRHAVITGFTIIDGVSKTTVTRAIETKVYFRRLSSKEIDAYLTTGKPMQFAGGYAIQERSGIFVKKIEGDYFNIVGLPLGAVAEALIKCGVKIL